jgi:hypothetical protein
MAAIVKTYKARIEQDGAMCAIPVPFDPKAVFGTMRAPVAVTLNGYTYRSTIACMGGPPFIPFRKSHREAAGVEGGALVTIRLALDQAPRTVDVPADLASALKRVAGGREGWKALSFTHQREHVEAIEDAKKPETRARRVERAVAMVVERAMGRAARGR